MSTMTRPRGPLPARVYWTRRILVLLVAFALVFGLSRLLGGTLGGSDGPSARPVGSTLDDTASETTSDQDAPTAGPVGSETPGPRKKAQKKKVLAEPEGTCDSADVKVTPVVGRAHAGSPVRIALKLTTRRSAACHWEVGPDSVVVKLTSGDDPIWSSQECPAVIPTQDVVPRRAKADRVTFTWNAKRSDSECSAATDWAMPGWYHVEAVARGSVKPVDHQFELKQPVRRTVTPSPTATPEPRRIEKKKRDRERDRDGEVTSPTEGRR